jgi:DNA invertase Pin-like site-specific DNA recombinase
MKTKRAAVYTRVSTDQQTTQNQLAQLRVVAKRMGGRFPRNLSITGSAVPRTEPSGPSSTPC